MDTELKKSLSKIANTIRELSMEAVQKLTQATQVCRWGALNSVRIFTAAC
jgi:hypothetical protein